MWPAATPPAGVVEWRKELGAGATVDASPVVNPNTGVIYLGTTGESALKPGARLFAFYPNGSLRWPVPLDGYQVRAAPAVRRDGFPVVGGRAGADLSAATVVASTVGGSCSERIFLARPVHGGGAGGPCRNRKAATGSRSATVRDGNCTGWLPSSTSHATRRRARSPDGLWRLDSPSTSRLPR